MATATTGRKDSNREIKPTVLPRRGRHLPIVCPKKLYHTGKDTFVSLPGKDESKTIYFVARKSIDTETDRH